MERMTVEVESEILAISLSKPETDTPGVAPFG